MNIILFCIAETGAGNEVVKALIDQGTPPSFIVPPNENHFLRNKTIELAHSFNIPVLMFNNNPSEHEFVTRINELKPELILVSSFTHLIPQSIYSSASIGAINAHPALLPEYRGPNPYFHVIANGEKLTGVTLHLLDDSFDTGNIISQTTLPIEPKDTSGTITAKLNRLSAVELSKLVMTTKSSGLPQSTKQIISVNHLAPKVDSSLKNIDWGKSAKSIDCYVRAANPFFNVFTTHNEINVTIFSGQIIKGEFNDATHGEILPNSKEHNGILVQTGDGAYLITGLWYGTNWRGDALSVLELGLVKIGEHFS